MLPGVGRGSDGASTSTRIPAFADMRLPKGFLNATSSTSAPSANVPRRARAVDESRSTAEGASLIGLCPAGLRNLRGNSALCGSPRLRAFLAQGARAWRISVSAKIRKEDASGPGAFYIAGPKTCAATWVSESEGLNIEPRPLARHLRLKNARESAFLPAGTFVFVLCFAAL